MRIITILIILFALFSCERSQDLPIGDITANVRKKSRVEPYITHDSVKLTLIKGDTRYSGFSDEKGDILIKDVEMGTYRLIYSCEGYSDHVVKSYMFYPSEITAKIGYVSLVEFPQLILENEILKIEEDPFSGQFQLIISADMTVLNDNHLNSKFRLYMSTSENVSYEHYEYSQLFFNDPYLNPEKPVNTVEYFYFINAPFKTGTKVFCRLYPSNDFNGGHVQHYWKNSNGYIIHEGVNSEGGTDVMEFTWPEL